MAVEGGPSQVEGSRVRRRGKAQQMQPFLYRGTWVEREKHGVRERAYGEGQLPGRRKPDPLRIFTPQPLCTLSG